MSRQFIITPYEPKHWETAVSGLRIDTEVFGRRLVEQWKNAQITLSAKGGLLWQIPEDESAGFFGELQSNNQIVTFGPGNWTIYKDFILWYRQQVPENYPLYFFNSTSLESLIITSTTTPVDIERFI